MKTSPTTAAPKKATRDGAIEDLAPKAVKAVRGGINFVAKVSKSSPA